MYIVRAIRLMTSCFIRRQVSRRIADTKAAKEVAALDAFFETLADRPDRALYGPAHVLAAHDMLAIDKLLITDGLFRTSDTRQRRRWVYFNYRMGNSYELTSCFSF